MSQTSNAQETHTTCALGVRLVWGWCASGLRLVPMHLQHVKTLNAHTQNKLSCPVYLLGFCFGCASPKLDSEMPSRRIL